MCTVLRHRGEWFGIAQERIIGTIRRRIEAHVIGKNASTFDFEDASCILKGRLSAEKWPKFSLPLMAAGTRLFGTHPWFVILGHRSNSLQLERGNEVAA